MNFRSKKLQDRFNHESWFCTYEDAFDIFYTSPGFPKPFRNPFSGYYRWTGNMNKIDAILMFDYRSANFKTRERNLNEIGRSATNFTCISRGPMDANCRRGWKFPHHHTANYTHLYLYKESTTLQDYRLWSGQHTRGFPSTEEATL